MPSVLCHSRSGNNYKVAQAIGWPVLVAEDNPTLPDGFLVVVCSNTGDEELHPVMERYLLGLTPHERDYAICELGNYFGFERDCFGCKLVARSLLDKLGWVETSHVSIDSLPDLDWKRLNQWIALMKSSH